MGEITDKPALKIDFEGLDPFGLKSAAELSKEATKFGLEAAKAFLKATCKPMLEEFGLTMRDKVTNWKLTNILQMLEKAQGKLIFDLDTNQLKINPRVAYHIVENVSTISDDNLQDMWAGLFAASCNSVEDDENIFFTDILSKLTAAQVKFLNFLCTNCQKQIEIQRLPESRLNGDVVISFLSINYEDILREMGTQSRLKADSEFSHLESMGLLKIHNLGSMAHLTTIQNVKSRENTYIKPTITAIRLYIKCNGSSLSPFDYFLPEISKHYSILLEGIPNIPSDLVNFLETQVKVDEKRIIQIRLNNNQIIIDTEESQILANDLADLLRPFMIRYHLENIKKSMEVVLKNKPLGTFTYKSGFHKYRS